MESSVVEEGEGSKAKSFAGGELGIKSGVWISEMGSSIGSDLTRISSFGRRKGVVGTPVLGVPVEVEATPGFGSRLRSGNGTIDPISGSMGFF